MLSSYYRHAIFRVYYVYEFVGVEQIFRTKRTTLRMIKGLPDDEFNVVRKFDPSGDMDQLEVEAVTLDLAPDFESSDL
jgi:hypothetical protein